MAITGIAGVANIAVACEVCQLQHRFFGRQFKGRAFDVALAPYGTVAVSFVTNLNGSSSVLGQFFVCQVCPDQRNGDRHIVLGPAELVQRPDKAQIAGKIMHIFRNIYLNLIIHNILLAVCFLINRNEGEILAR